MKNGLKSKLINIIKALHLLVPNWSEYRTWKAV
jgi:hypothetical protein